MLLFTFESAAFHFVVNFAGSDGQWISCKLLIACNTTKHDTLWRL